MLTNTLTLAAHIAQVAIALPLSNVHFDLTSVLSSLAHGTVIMQTPGITRCLLSEATDHTGQKESLLNTEGINMHELFKYSNVCVLLASRIALHLAHTTMYSVLAQQLHTTWF